MSVTWTLNVDGQLFGPYNAEEMREFELEGRVVHWSLVSRTGQNQFHPASEDPEFSALFDNSKLITKAQDSDAARPAQKEAPAQALPNSVKPPIPPPKTPIQSEPQRFGRLRETGKRSRFVILSDMKSSSITNLEEEIFKLGDSYRFMPQAWVLNSEASLNTIRHALMQKLGKLDTIFIVDTVHDRAAWFNFGPEADIRVRRMWLHISEDDRKEAKPSTARSTIARQP